MFGKPEWFVPKKIGWGLTPVTWQGWVFTGVVAALIAVPFNLLLLTVGWPEALIWMAVGIVALCVEVYHILQAMQSPPKVDSDEDVRCR